MVRCERAVVGDKTGKVCITIRSLIESPIQTDINNKRMHCLVKQSNRIRLASGITG